MAAKGWYRPRRLPHFDGDVVQSLVFRLADSLPQVRLKQLERELEGIAEEKRFNERRRRIEALLDAGMGRCALRSHAAAMAVQATILHGHGEAYHVHAWVIMPNHVHVLLNCGSEQSLANLVRTWKSVSARRIGGPRPFWQKEYWDRFIRDESHFLSCAAYIEYNPVAAGLAPTPEDWPHGSAAMRARLSG